MFFLFGAQEMAEGVEGEVDEEEERAEEHTEEHAVPARRKKSSKMPMFIGLLLVLGGAGVLGSIVLHQGISRKKPKYSSVPT